MHALLANEAGDVLRAFFRARRRSKVNPQERRSSSILRMRARSGSCSPRVPGRSVTGSSGPLVRIAGPRGGSGEHCEFRIPVA